MNQQGIRCDNPTCHLRRGHEPGDNTNVTCVSADKGKRHYCSLTCRILDGWFGPDAATREEMHLRRKHLMLPLDAEIDA